MEPALWGPAIWQVMFSCAWCCSSANFPVLRAFILEQMPMLIPCARCRQNFARHLNRVHKRAKGEPRSADHAFRWLWYLKDEVNLQLGRKSIRFDELVGRYVLHGGIVDDVVLGDTLVLLAISARASERDDLFIALCETLSTLLPLPADSEFLRHARCVQRPVVQAAVRVARAARIERGLKPLVLAHYMAVAD